MHLLELKVSLSLQISDELTKLHHFHLFVSKLPIQRLNFFFLRQQQMFIISKVLLGIQLIFWLDLGRVRDSHREGVRRVLIKTAL